MLIIMSGWLVVHNQDYPSKHVVVFSLLSLFHTSISFASNEDEGDDNNNNEISNGI